jgi:hypothetical protein
VPADDDELRARLGALEAEVKADADAQKRRRSEAELRVRAQRAKQQAETEELRSRQTAIVKSKSARGRGDRDRSGDLETALDLARKASDAKHELTKPREAGEKSWLTSGALSLFFGPLGWLYAGSFRESIPASAMWLIAAFTLGKILPVFLLMPVLMVAMPISAIAGVVYAIGHNRAGERIRLFGDEDKPADPRIGKLGAGSGSRRDEG